MSYSRCEVRAEERRAISSAADERWILQRASGICIPASSDHNEIPFGTCASGGSCPAHSELNRAAMPIQDLYRPICRSRRNAAHDQISKTVPAAASTPPEQTSDGRSLDSRMLFQERI